MKKNGVTVEVESYKGRESVSAHPLCVIHRALLPGHPTDSFVVEFNGRVMDPALYPSVVGEFGPQLIHVCLTFEALVSCLAAIGMRMTWDEPEKDIPADLVDANGEAASVCKIKAVEITEGHQITRLTWGEKKDAEMAQEAGLSGGGDSSDATVGYPGEGLARSLTRISSGPAVFSGADFGAGESSPATQERPAKASGLDQ